ncbi:hypothetical protein [Agrococcus lahaulensis]|uniref:hypothetical protein n=1 Tax=Agrococcus lahaulensis TaxID=341722 RepID=UPI00047AD9B4|nr:hypothetical protein [Agrococcus lahaulensis]
MQRTKETDGLMTHLSAAISTRADRARLRGARRQAPVTTEFEIRILREGDRKVLHAGAVSSLVSTAFLEALFMTTSDATLQRLVPRNPRAPLWVIARGVHRDFDEAALASFASRMGRPDLAAALGEPIADGTVTVEERWVAIGGGAPPLLEPRLRCGDAFVGPEPAGDPDDDGTAGARRD